MKHQPSAWNPLPPDDVAPEALFRRLLRFPYPVAPITWRAPFAPSFPLYVRALLPHEWDDVLEADERSHVFVGLSLCNERGESVTTPDACFDWRAKDLDAAAVDALRVMSRIGPTYRKSNAQAWRAKLLAGAREEQAQAAALGAYEVAGQHLVEVPERYFGVPKRMLCDGHWMAYRAAVALMIERG